MLHRTVYVLFHIILYITNDTELHLTPLEIEIHTGYKYSTMCFDMNYIAACA